MCGRSAVRNLFGAVCGLFLAATAVAQQTNQFYLATQYDWGASRGFIFMLEGTPRGSAPTTISDVKLTLGVGDGHSWRFFSGRTDWHSGTKYNVSAQIGGGETRIEINGKVVGQSNGEFVPADGQLMYDQPSSIMRGPANYSVKQGLLHLTSDNVALDLQPAESRVPPQLLMLNPAAGRDDTKFSAGKTVQIQTSFEFGQKANLRQLSPFIDRYGQSLQAQWPGKVKSDADLKSADQVEAKRFSQWGKAEKFDHYGGATDAPWKQKATGFFCLNKHEGKWWLVSPEGNPCFYVGLCNAPAEKDGTPVTGREYLYQWLPPRQGQFAEAWQRNPWHAPGEQSADYFAFDTANFIRKYGDNWSQEISQAAVRRARALAFSGFGKWSTGGLGVCTIPVLFARGPVLVKHPDVFDPAVRRQMVDALRGEIEPAKNDPWIVGWSIGNEKDEEISTDEVRAILAMPDNVPARQAFLKLAGTAKPDDATIEKLRQYYEDAYYKFLYETVKSIDPNHLYFGSWVTPNWWNNESDWSIDAAHCDVVGFDWYSLKFDNEPARHLIEESRKPVLCGEFSFPPTYNGQRGFGTYGVHSSTEAEEGQLYTQWMHDAAENPYCVGVCYFEYRDEPLTGRGPGNSRDALVVGEDYAFGVVDVTDRIKWDFADYVRKANLQAATIRFGGANK